MNPLKSIPGTIALGFVIGVVVLLLVGQKTGIGNALLPLTVWLHVFFGIIWVGLLYYLNFVQVPSVAQAAADTGGPGPAAINKYVAPRALLWFRWGAVFTWITGAAVLEVSGFGLGKSFMLAEGVRIIGIGAWLGTIMLFNVWVLIWPNQQKILGLKQATAEEIAKAKVVALMTSRTNALLSIPMLLCMVGQMHGLSF